MGPRLLKYMGSKQSMLQNGLGQLILDRVHDHTRIVDLFSGGGSVSWYAAEHTELPVLAVDLQEYAALMARAVITRTSAFESEEAVDCWINRVVKLRNKSDLWREACRLESREQTVPELVFSARELCFRRSRIGPVWNAYGGHYFSPKQAITLDYLLKYLPTGEPERTVCSDQTSSLDWWRSSTPR